jgi:hypothetical protein
VGAFTSIDTATKLGAASLVISAILALYIGLAQMWNITFGRTVLPLYPWKNLERPVRQGVTNVTQDSSTTSDRSRVADRATSGRLDADLEVRPTITRSSHEPTDEGRPIDVGPEHARQDMDHIGADWDLTQPRHGEHGE